MAMLRVRYVPQDALRFQALRSLRNHQQLPQIPQCLAKGEYRNVVRIERGCAVVISHDRWFLDRIATHILAFESDSKVIWFDGNYTEYEADKKARLGKAAAQPHRITYRKLTRGIQAE